MKLINLEQIRKSIGETFSRFAMTIAYCAALALFVCLMNHDLDFGKEHLNTAVTIYFVTGIFVSFSIDLRRQIYGKRWMWIAAIISHIAIILNAIYMAHVGQTDVKIGWNNRPYMSLTTAHWFDIAAVVALCVVSPFVRPFFGKKDDLGMWHFSRKFIMNGALNGIVVIGLFVGGLLLVTCAENLFNPKLSLNNLYADVAIWLWLLLFPTMILMRTPHLLEISTEKIADKFSFVILRLFSILFCIYLLMLYAYILRIAFTWELPKGMVSMPVSCMMILLIVVRCIAYGINTEGKKIDSRFLKLLPWLALPTLVLMSVGICRRLMDYGMTAPRFYLILLNLWFYAMCVYMILRQRLMPIVVSFIVIAFFSSFGPTSAWRLFPETEETTGKAAAEKEKIYGTIVLHPHEELPDSLNEYNFKTIFLAGTIDMGSSEDWQAQTAEYFSKQDGNFLLYNPRQENWDATREGEMDYQVNWELEHLEKANLIIMNFLPDSKSPITLLELGLYARSYKELHVYCPKEFYRYDNVRITCERYNVKMYETFEELLDQVIKK